MMLGQWITCEEPPIDNHDRVRFALLDMVEEFDGPEWDDSTLDVISAAKDALGVRPAITNYDF